jgi:hypothetical protein
VELFLQAFKRVVLDHFYLVVEGNVELLLKKINELSLNLVGHLRVVLARD